MQKSRVLLEDWGKAQLEWWHRSIQLEIATADEIKEVLKGYLRSVRDLHVLGSTVRASLEYWENVDIHKDIEAEWQPKQLLSVMSVDFIRNSLELMDSFKVVDLTLRHLSQWSEMRNLPKATGERQVLIDSLSIKTFECEFSTGKSWVPGTLVSTIDQNIIIATEFSERAYSRPPANP